MATGDPGPFLDGEVGFIIDPWNSSKESRYLGTGIK